MKMAEKHQDTKTPCFSRNETAYKKQLPACISSQKPLAPMTGVEPITFCHFSDSALTAAPHG
jgi:hypothetical protein